MSIAGHFTTTSLHPSQGERKGSEPTLAFTYGAMNQPFEDYLAAEFMKDYHGDKDHYEDAFESWLENLENGELIEYGNKAMQNTVVIQ